MAGVWGSDEFYHEEPWAVHDTPESAADGGFQKLENGMPPAQFFGGVCMAAAPRSAAARRRQDGEQPVPPL